MANQDAALAARGRSRVGKAFYIYSQMLFISNLFFPGHAPGKNTQTRVTHRNAAAKPGPQAGAKLSKASADA